MFFIFKFPSCFQDFYFITNHIKVLVCQAISSSMKGTKGDSMIVKHGRTRQLLKGDVCKKVSIACISVDG